MIHNSPQNILCTPLKQGDMIVVHNDNINNIHYKSGLNIYIGNYTIWCYTSVDSIHVIEYFGQNIMDDDTIAILKNWLVTFLISLFDNLWNLDVS